MAVVVLGSWHPAADFSSAHCMPSGSGDSVPALPDTWLGRHSYQGACCAGGLCHSRLQIFSSFYLCVGEERLLELTLPRLLIYQYIVGELKLAY